MASELRWILLAICVPVLGAIWWWTSRRTGQAENPELRETQKAELRETQKAVRADAAVHPSAPDEHSAEWGVPPFEPLSIRTADFEEMEVLDHIPMTAHAEPVPAPAERLGPAAVPSPGEGRVSGNRPQPPNADAQRIVTLRVCAANESRWSGVGLLAALDRHGMAHGRYQVFHRKQSDGRTLFCAASLVEPGTFNLARMPAEEFRGLTLFAVLPGPQDALQTLDALIETAVGLAQTLHGTVQDSTGQPLSPERAVALREEVAQFQAMLAMN